MSRSCRASGYLRPNLKSSFTLTVEEERYLKQLATCCRLALTQLSMLSAVGGVVDVLLSPNRYIPVGPGPIFKELIVTVFAD